MSRSPYYLGFTTQAFEARVDALPLRGVVPDWLKGTLVRTGPARFEVGERTYNHWFDGLAMLHGFGFASGRVSYTNRYLHSRSYLDGMARGTIIRREFATDPLPAGRVLVLSAGWRQRLRQRRPPGRGRRGPHRDPASGSF